MKVSVVRMQRPTVKPGEHKVDKKRWQDYKQDTAKAAAHRAAKLQAVRDARHTVANADHWPHFRARGHVPLHELVDGAGTQCHR
jgi:hypothetical protein